VKAYLAEAIGVFALTFIGVGAILSNNLSGGQDFLMVALAHGLTIAVMVSATANLSGGHLNPAVSFGAWLGGKLSLSNMFKKYWTAQVAGSALAAGVAIVLFGKEAVLNGTPTLNLDLENAFLRGVGLEAIATFFLVFVVYGTGIDPRGPKIGGLAIGLAVTIGILAIGSHTGGALNPARMFGPWLVTGNLFGEDGLIQALVYWVGPLLGGGVAGWLYSRIMMKS
jgi:MIP family channel proteins